MGGMTAPEAPDEQPLVGECFVATYPPFEAWKAEHNPALPAVLRHPVPDAPVALYVHVPFCQKKCDYCYFLSFVGQPGHVINDYVETVVDEIELYASFPAIAGRRLSSVFFGGGTPSLLSTEQARELIAGLKSALPWKGVEEVTFESTPVTVRATFIEALLDLGVTRLSMGAESFDDQLLELNGCAHRAAQTVQAYSILREAGCTNINLDLLCGLPGESAESWNDTIERVIALAPESVTIYQAEIRRGSGTYRKLDALIDAPPLIPQEEKHERAARGFARLAAAGYTGVNAYSAVRDSTRNRLAYEDHLWHGGDVLGLGVGAYGYVQGVHYENEPRLAGYSNAVHDGRLPLYRSFPLSPRDRMIREFVLATKFGFVERQPLQQKYGADVVEVLHDSLARLSSKGMLTVGKKGVQFTDRGLLSVDWLSPTFFDVPFKAA